MYAASEEVNKGCQMPELELEMAVGVGTDPGSSARAARLHDH